MDRPGKSTVEAQPAGANVLQQYVPAFVAEWLRDAPEQRHRAIDCTLVFADISGFTRLTEMLAARGKAGAEEMADLINLILGELLTAAYRYGAGHIKHGGDAALLLFTGPAHAERACRAAAEMQTVIRREGRLQTSRGPLRLRMSVGVHSAQVEFLLVGDSHRELLVLGPAVTVLTQLEKLADA